jgi:hypothetical protein
MKVLFLDIDGVLNSREWFIVNKENVLFHSGLMHRHAEDLDPQACKLVNQLCTEFSLSIVISSTWRRLHSLSEIQKMFASRGLSAPIIGATPQLRSGYRGQEVDEWLYDHPGLPHYVILDDDGDFGPHQPLVQTNNEYGVCYRDIDKARTLLKNNT